MATKIYESETIILIDGKEIYLTPLKIKYLREFMDFFGKKEEDEDMISHLAKCATICMKQFSSDIKTIDDFEDSVDVKTMYKILDICAGIRFDDLDKEEPTENFSSIKNSEGSWDKMDLADLEAEAFLIGIWKDFEDLESSLSLQELTAIVNKKREMDYSDKKFAAAMQGVDLDKESGKPKDDPWEAMKRRVFGGQRSSDPNDVTNLRGKNAVQAGFGIGMGLDYQEIR